MRGEEIAAGDVSSPEEGIRILSDKVMVRQAVVVNHSQYCCISVLSGTVQERRNIPDGLEYTSKQYSIWSVVSPERLKISRACSAVEALVEEPKHLKRARTMPSRVSGGRKL
ncbi:hypothetical protein QQF64_002486 [Cirrhinus molitorella]|uniref:Uncharacterized protein n=1 Tax=Cirrhinus molitorella TaxID=172907 RepID=A0ABR3MQ97_9TELE